MRIYAARHGQTQWNAEDRICGSTDIPLNEAGLAQAEKLGEMAANYGIDLIIASPLIRARQTAAVIGEHCGAPILIEERLREQDFGEFEGVSRKDAAYQVNRLQFPFRHPGGESILDLAARVYGFLGELKEKYEEKTLLLVCHGCVCRMIRSYFVTGSNEDYFSFTEENTGIRCYEL